MGNDNIYVFLLLQGKHFDAEIPGCKKYMLFLLLDTTQSSIFWQLSLTMSRHAVKVRNQEEGTHVLTDKYIVDVYYTCWVKSIRIC